MWRYERPWRSRAAADVLDKVLWVRVTRWSARLARTFRVAVAAGAVTVILSVLSRSARVMDWFTLASIAVTFISVVLPSQEGLAGESGGEGTVAALLQASREGAQRRQGELLGAEAERNAIDPVFLPVTFSPDLTGAGTVTLHAAGRVTGLDELAGAMAAEPPGPLVIRGSAGSGKTVAATLLVLRMLKMLQAPGKPVPGRVPVLVSVAGWTAGERFEEWLAGRLETEYKVDRTIGADLVRKCQVLPILDGLDELDNDAGGRPRGVEFLQALKSWRDSAVPEAPAPVVITCGSGCDAGLEREVQRLWKVTQVQLQDLESGQVRAYVNDRLAVQPALAEWREVLGTIGTPAGAVIGRVLAAPWRLFLAVTLSQAGQEGWPGGLLVQLGEDPLTAERRIRDDLLAGYVCAAVTLAPWLGERDVPTVKDKRRAEKDERRALKVQRWLRTLAVLLAQQAGAADARGHTPEMTVMNSTDLIPHLVWPAAGVAKVRVAHAVLGLATLVLAFFSVFAVLGDTWSYSSIPAAQRSLSATIVWIAAVAVTFAAAGWLGWGSRWPRLHIGTQPHARFRIRALAGWLWHALQSRSYGHGFIYSVQVIASLIRRRNLAGARMVVRQRQDRARWSAGAELGSPMDALRAYPRYIVGFLLLAAVLLSAAVMAAVLVALGSVYQTSAHGFPIAAVAAEFLKIGAVFVIVALAIAGVWLSATPWARYVVGIALAACRPRSQLPPRLGRFLEWACRAGLLHRAGATYQFRHRELQEWFLRCAR
jgi:hypothetical protein